MLNFNEKITTGKIASRSNRDFYPENLQKDQTNETYLKIATNINPLGSFVKNFSGIVLVWQLKLQARLSDKIKIFIDTTALFSYEASSYK